MGGRWGRRKRRRVSLRRSPVLPIQLRHHRSASVKPDTIDSQILHYALDIVARFGKRNAFHPIDGIDLGIARVAVLLHPLLNAAPAGIVAGERHNVRAAIFLQERAESGRAHLCIVDRIRDHPIPIIGDAEPLGGVASGFWRDLHQADRVGRRLVALVERAFGACYRIDDAAVDCGPDGAMLRNSDRRKGVKVQLQPAGECRLPDLQHDARVIAATGKFGKGGERCDVSTLLREISDKTQDDVALAEHIEHIGGTHDFVQNWRTVIWISAQGSPQLYLVNAEFGARKLPVIGGAMAGWVFIVSPPLFAIAEGLGRTAPPVVRPRKYDWISRSLVNMDEMGTRRRRIIEVA